VILLTSTNDVLTVTESGTQVVNVHASWVGLNGTTVTPARQNTIISSTAVTPVVPSPAGSTQYNVKSLVITNTDASVSTNITVQHTDGTNLITLIKMTLPASDTLTWTEDEGWAFVVNGVAQSAGAAMATNMSDYSPQFDSYNTGVQSQLKVDPSSNLVTRSTVLTDEGGFYDHFNGTSLTTALTGTLTFVNGSTVVTGTGTSFATQIQQYQFIKLAADAESAFMWVSSIQSNTQLTLESGYPGSSTTGAAVVSNWATVTGAGGSIVVASSICAITNGTGSGATTYMYRPIDQQPIQVQCFGYALGLVPGQTEFFGFVDNPATPIQKAYLQFGNGLPANQFYFVTSGSGGTQDTLTQLCNVPPGLPNNAELTFVITFAQNKIVVSIGSPNVVEPSICATAVQNIPSPYTFLYAIIGFVNTNTITTSATVYADGLLITDCDRVEIANSFYGDPVGMLVSGKNNTTGQPQVNGSDNNNALSVSLSAYEDMTGVPRGSPAVVQLGSTSQQNYSLGRVKLALGNVGQDRGDPDLDGGRGLPVEQVGNDRRLAELGRLKAIDMDLCNLRGRSSERMSSITNARSNRDGRIG